MTMWLKQGVIGDLQSNARKGLGRVADLFHSHKQDIYVTSIRDGNHSAGSLHYDGLAFDIRNPDEVSPIELRGTLGPNWDVVFEKDHIHCEYDPKEQ